MPLHGPSLRSASQGYRDKATEAFRREHEIDTSAKLMRDEFAYEGGAVPRSRRSDGQRTAGLTPLNHKARRRRRAKSAVPTH
jgi:hypothetical protein